MTRLLVIFLLTFICSIPALGEPKIVIPTEKKYPPYPEVWGYDLSDYPGMNGEDKVLLFSYKMADGDIWFTYFYTDPHSKEQSVYLTKFFAKEIVKISRTEYDKLLKPYFEKLKQSDELVIKVQGNEIKRMMTFGGNKCLNNELFYSVRVRNLQMSKEKHYSVYGAYPVIKRQDTAGYDPDLCPHYTPFSYVQLYPLATKFISLEDNTFITLDDGGPLIIRFKMDFTTQFICQHGIRVTNGNSIPCNFFVLPYEKVEELYEKVIEEKLSASQGLQDYILLQYYK